MTTERDVHALAGEYVLGLTGPEETKRIERDMEHDAEFARAVAEWRERLSGLDDVADRVEPAPALWERISSGIARRAVAETERSSPGVLSGIWENLGFWRNTALAGALAVLLLGISLTAALMNTGPAPVVVAILEADDSTPGAIVEAYADGSVLLRPLTDINVPEGKTLQVWTLWDREVGPVPLGLMARAHVARLQAGGQPVPRPQQLYEITLEPEGGSPTGRPTGPILFKGLASAPL